MHILFPNTSNPVWFCFSTSCETVCMVCGIFTSEYLSKTHCHCVHVSICDIWTLSIIPNFIRIVQQVCNMPCARRIISTSYKITSCFIDTHETKSHRHILKKKSGREKDSTLMRTKNARKILAVFTNVIKLMII